VTPRRVPIVGVTTYYAEVSWGPWQRTAAVLYATYFELVAQAGGRPVLLPPVHSAPPGATFGASEAIDALDALVLVGGGDLDAAAYGQSATPTLDGVNPVRDESEFALLDAALAVDLPILAICRGLQLLNVRLGGTLLQHLPDRLPSISHQPAAGQFCDVEVRTIPGSRTAAIMGERAIVRCSHHQAAHQLGKGLLATAYSVEAPGIEPVVEALELPDASFVVGLQWHPEEANDVRPFEALVGAVTR
jgi:putative glutamine amidotransferase